MKKLSVYLLLIFVLLSCTSTKHVAENEYLLTKNIIFLDSAKDKSSELQKYILQKPNPSLLGLPLGLYMHNLGNHNKPKTPAEWGKKNPRSYNFIKSIFSEKQSIAYARSFIKLNQWFLDYQEPQIMSAKKVENTKNNLWAYYKTQGYFKSKVVSNILRDSLQKKASVNYYITKGNPTILDSINIKIESAVLDSIYKTSGITSLLKKGNQYNDKTFRNEANNVVKLFKNNGIYYFTESALGFYVDSTRADYKTNVDFIISKDRLILENGNYIKTPFKVQKIKQIEVVTDYSYLKKNEVFLDSISYKDISFFAYDKQKYNPKYLSQAIFFKPGDVYKDTLDNLTRTHLKLLKNFKTTKIEYSAIGSFKDALKMAIYLAPIEKYTLGFDTELTHSNIRRLGTSAKFSIINRNTFKGAELLKLSILGSYFNANNGPGWEIGADASLEIPRFMAPFGFSKVVPKEMSPRTLFSIGSSFQKNIGLDRQTITFQWDYKWQYNRKKTIQLELFNTQYIQNLNTNNYFRIYSSEFLSLNEIGKKFTNNQNFALPEDETQVATALEFMNDVSTDTAFQEANPEAYNASLNILNRYNIVTSDFLIPTIAYSFTYNSQTSFKDNNFSFFKIRIANAGNILGLISKNTNANGKKTLANIPLAQYFKTDIEYKQFWDMGNNSVFGFRTFLGTILNYNNSDIPFTKSYFAGGSNDIRAWQTYELGPGSTNTGLEFNTGNLKFLTSAEYRFNIVGKLKGALFVDAGNIWDITGASFVTNKAKFTGLTSLQDIAIGSGFGTRLDFNFLIVRFDLGFKTYEPYLNGNKWFTNYNFANAVFNVGINYPF